VKRDMGMFLVTWRARIGLFCSAVLGGGAKETETLHGERMFNVSKAYLAYGFVLLKLLIIVWVGKNPGPPIISQKTDISEIKTVLNIAGASNEQIVSEIKQIKSLIKNVIYKVLNMESAL